MNLQLLFIPKSVQTLMLIDFSVEHRRKKNNNNNLDVSILHI